MALSALYHTFSCRSKEDCYRFLTFDLLGIALSLLAIYTSGIYYAFWCDTVSILFRLKRTFSPHLTSVLGFTIVLFSNRYAYIHLCHGATITSVECKWSRENDGFCWMGSIWRNTNCSLDNKNGWFGKPRCWGMLHYIHIIPYNSRLTYSNIC